MAENHTQPKMITEIIDQIERMREELLMFRTRCDGAQEACPARAKTSR